MKPILLSLMILALGASVVLAQVPVAEPNWTAFVIREASDGTSGAPVIQNEATNGDLEFAIVAAGQKAGLGTDLINGITLDQIATLYIDRLDDVNASGSLYGPYFNIWVTDGAGHYAVLANEPSDAEWATDRWDVRDWATLSSKRCKVYETPDVGSGGDPGTSWVADYAAAHGWTVGEDLRFSHVAGLVIEPPSAAYILDSSNNVGGGAPDDLYTNTARGYNWIFGDTASNYISGGDGFIVADYRASSVVDVHNADQDTYYATIQAAIDDANAGETIEISAGTYLERPVVGIALTFVGEGEGTTFVDAGVGAVGGSYGWTISGDGVSISNLTLVGDPGLSTPRYGFKPSSVSDFSLTNVTATEFYRTGVDLLGVTNGALTNVSAINNGGHGFSILDCHGVTVTNAAASGNGWQGVSVATWGRYSPLGTSGIVFTGTNQITDPFQLEMGDYNNPGVAPTGDAIITYSTDIGDGADLTVQAADYTMAVHGTQDDSPDQVRIWLAPDLATAALLPAVGGPVGHFTGEDMYIESLVGDVVYVTPGCSLKTAILAAPAGGTVDVAGGTYVESGQIPIDKDISLIGDAADRAVVMTDGDTGGSGDSRGWFLQAAGTHLVVQNLVFDGTGHNIYQGFRSVGSCEMDNCDLRNIVYPGYAGTGIAAFGDGNWNITNCAFENMGRIGLLAFGSGLTNSSFVGNSYTGKGVGDWLDYACDISAGAVMTVEGNTITGCRGVASSDGSTSAALLVTTYFAPGTNAVINNNVLTGNTAGVAVGYDETDTSVCSGSGNDFSGNDEGVSNTGAAPVDFRGNSWGDASGPYHAAMNPNGTGVPVGDSVFFTPWTGRTTSVVADLTVTPNGPFYWEGTPSVGVDGDFAPGFDPGAFQAPSAYTRYGWDPEAVFGREITVGELYQITYYTQKDDVHTLADPGDWYLVMYTDPYDGSPGSSWYGNRINSEPYFAYNLNETAGEWTQWQCLAGQDNQLRFYDSSTGYFGSYTDGFLADLAIDPTFTAQPLMLMGLSVGTGWADGFDGLLDGVTIELVSGETVSFDFVSGNALTAITPEASGPINCSQWQDLTFSVNLTEGTPDLFLYNAVIEASPEVTFGFDDISDMLPFTDNNETFLRYQSGTNQWTISGSTVGNPAYPVVSPGAADLFKIRFHAVSDGDAAITIQSLTLRDPDNNTIPVVTSGATISVDCTAPAPVTGITAAPGHNKIDVSWTHDGADVDHYVVFSGLWYDLTPGNSAYPEYDDHTADVIPTPPADYAAALGADPIWLPLTAAYTTAQTQTWNDSANRGVYYYTVFAIDAAGNASAAPTAVDRATNYWLGDVYGTPSDPAPDGEVDPLDIDQLGTYFGNTIATDGPGSHVDVGPTDDYSRLGIPTTDSIINFEDLMIFALNFGVVSDAKGKVPAGDSVDLAWVAYDDGTMALRLNDGACLKGLRIVADAPVESVIAGGLLDEQSELTFLKNVGNKLDANVAVMGVNNTFTGTGDLLVISAESAISVDDLVITARGADNRDLEIKLSEASDTPLPRVFALQDNYPNPFNPQTKIAFSLPEAEHVRLTIYGVDGRVIRTLVDENRSAGLHEIIWQGRDRTGRNVASGTYFYRIEAGPYSNVKKMTLMK